MKQLLLLFLIPLSALASDFRLQVTPGPYYQGREYRLVIKSSNKLEVNSRLPQLDKLSWDGRNTSSSYRSMNGNITRETTLQLAFSVSEPGPITIPPFAIEVDGKRQMTTALTLDIKPSPFAGACRIDMRFNGSKVAPTEIAEDETLEVDMRFIAKPGINIRPIDWPKINLEGGKIVPYNHPRTSQRQTSIRPEFKLYGNRSFKLEYENDGKNQFQVLTFTMRLRPTVGNTFKANFTAPIGVSSGRGRTAEEELALSYKLAQIPIKKLPPVNEANTLNTGLIGEWQTLMSTDRQRVAVGSPVTLTITFLGEGDPDRLVNTSTLLKSLHLKGFKVLKEDLKSSHNQNGQNIIKAEFILIPEAADAIIAPEKLATYSLKKKQYILHDSDINLQIIGQAPAVVTQVENTQKRIDSTTEDERDNDPDFIAPDKQLTIDHWQAPITDEEVDNSWRGVSPIVWALALLAPLLALAQKTMPKPQNNEKKELKQERKNILKKLSKKESLEDSSFMHSQLLPHLARSLKLPQASTADEIAEKCSNFSLQFILKEIGKNFYAPKKVYTFTNKELKKLIKALSFALALVPFCEIHASDMSKANDFFDEGKFKQAEEIYRQKLQQKPNSAPSHYNLANALFKQNKRPEALAHYLAALKIDPAGKSIARNAQFTANSLKVKLTDFGYLSWRDGLSPKAWLTIAIFCWIIFCLTFLAPKKFWLWSLMPAFLALLSLSLVLWQENSFWRDGSAIVTVDQTATFTQANKAFNTSRTLQEATAIEVLAIKHDMLFVAFGQERFWINKKDCFIY